jgi:apolipoprotein D and lipocalin family protein
MRIVLATMFLVVCLNTGCLLPRSNAPLDVVERVEVERYMGKWYEIARYPNFFQASDCMATTAEYTLLDNGRVRVENRCRRGSFDGREDSIVGTARVVDTETNAKLKVQFFPPFEGDYWIIGLDADYQWAVVGEPSRNFLWILSRTPTMDEAVYAEITAGLPDLDYDPNRLMLTAQPSK